MWYTEGRFKSEWEEPVEQELTPLQLGGDDSRIARLEEQVAYMSEAIRQLEQNARDRQMQESGVIYLDGDLTVDKPMPTMEDVVSALEEMFPEGDGWTFSVANAEEPEVEVYDDLA